MNWSLLRRLLGVIALLIGASMLFSLPWAFPVFGQVSQVETHGLQGLLWGMAVSGMLGALLYKSGRNAQGPIYRREAMAVVALGWLLAAALGAVPFYLSGTQRRGGTPLGLADAFFESMSGFTTTGASVLGDLEVPNDGSPPLVPRCILFWRSFTHFLGGMGIVVLFVAVLGHLGGAKLLFRREVSGLARETLQPRIRHTARLLWAIYVVLTLGGTALLWFEGMSVFEALCHSFGSVATGGFGTRNASIGAFHSHAIETTVIALMVLGGTNFTLYYYLITQQYRSVLENRELRLFITLLVLAAACVAFSLRRAPSNYSAGEALRHGSFQVVSIMTATGFSTDDFERWPAVAKGMLLVLMFVGGCVGSTSGGVKVLRCLLVVRVLKLEILHAFRPKMVQPLRVGTDAIDPEVRHDVVVYVAVVAAVFVVAWLGLLATQPQVLWDHYARQQEQTARPMIDCAAAVATCMNSVGPGLGLVGPSRNFGDFNALGKLLLSSLMVLGRLEYFTLLVLFQPSFWRIR